MYYKLTLRRGPSLLGELMILRRGLPFTEYVDAFKAWALLLHYMLMILRRGLLFTVYVDEFKAWALPI